MVQEVHREAYKILKELISKGNETVPRAALIHGAGGSGKTTLCKRFAHNEGFHLRLLTATELGDDDCGVVEQRVIQTFRKAIDDAEGGVKTMIVMDNVDLWSGGVGGMRVVAGVYDGLSELLESGCRDVLLVCTACEVGGVAACLVGDGRIALCVRLDVLRYSERVAMWQALCAGCEGGQDGVDVAAMTAGFSAADVAGMARRVATGWTVSRAVREMTPSILSAHSDVIHRGSAATAERRRRERALIGLEEAQAVLKQVASGRGAVGVGAARGAVIYGPCGSGKTTLLRRAVREAGGVILEPTAVTSWSIGEGERSLRRAFAAARALGSGVLGVEDVERIASRRDPDGAEGGGGGEDGGRRLLATLLTEVDEGGVVLLATTRELCRVDGALLRAGRLDVHVCTARGGGGSGVTTRA
ncbi:Cell division cycle protein 48-like [Gracilariopsis chorda]|uniref:Cell division cycle protein 48-like n=1 Tax=Gracilariopsis chorda TaxID=448386 RepID=A0A2V3IHC9_9FLOR|nr:Cell division cycle protein 48-like [Gracilariopsis chorda]|eukprot:PXF41494.1 Cell division cycle protein 48-like [Gracilariopsis chorda]